MPSDRNQADASPATPGAAPLEATAFVDAWEQSPSLLALRELVGVAGEVPTAIAARAALTHHELTALEHLIRGPLGPVELARILGVTSAASSGVVDRLVARGHASRAPHPHDGRRTVVTISESGREELLRHLLPMFVSLRDLDQQLDDADRAVVTAYLQSATDAIRRLL